MSLSLLGSVVGSCQPASLSNKHFVYEAVLPCQVE